MEYEGEDLTLKLNGGEVEHVQVSDSIIRKRMAACGWDSSVIAHHSIDRNSRNTQSMQVALIPMQLGVPQW